MCGIAGILRLDGAPVDPGALHRMAALMAHRGPDGQGFAAFPSDPAAVPRLWKDPARAAGAAGCPLGLAHRRLAILDLGETGHQPMTRDGRHWIVLNGEIYNHAALREELARRGSLFRGTSDTEVLLAAWIAWGERCLDRLEGMFAFAVWDRADRQLFLARDRVGMKPLYYAEASGAFGFASEIKPVLSGLGLAPRPRDAAAYDLLVRGLKDHRAAGFFEGVLQLPPGNLMVVKARPCPPRAYYDLGAAVAARAASLPRAPEAQVRLFREALQASVRSHLRSDVPTGTCLSGGLDSSAISGFVSRIRRDELVGLGATPGPDGSFHTFSVRSEDPALDEGPFIDAVIRTSGLPNHAVTPGAAGFFDALPELLRHQEEPFPSGSPYAQWLLMQEAASRGVKVLLDGQGADEILGGYPGMHLPAVADALAGGRLGWALGTWWRYAPGFPRIMGLALAGALAFHPPANLRGMAERRRGRGLLLRAREEAPDARPARDRFLTERLAQVTRHLPALLHYEDRNSMAQGIEARLPFLDRGLMELALALPADRLLENGLTKAALRAAAAEVLPPEVRDRRDKIGFATADRAWLAGGGARLQDLLDALERADSPWIAWKRVRGELPRYLEGKPRSPSLAALLITDLWRLQIAAPDYLAPRSVRE